MAAPNAPTLSVVNTGTGTSVTATLAGDAAVTHRLFYKKRADAAWTTGLTRSGDGIITQTGLTANNRYEVIAVSDNGDYSLPSAPASLDVFPTATAIKELIRQNIKAELQDLVSSGIASAVIAPKRYGEDPTFQHLELILVQGDPVEVPHGPEGGASCYQTWDQLFAVLCCIRLAEASATDVDQEMNNLEAHVIKKLCEDRDRGDYAIDTMIDACEAFPANRRGVDGVQVNFRVRFRVREDDPFSQT